MVSSTIPKHITYSGVFFLMIQLLLEIHLWWVGLNNSFLSLGVILIVSVITNLIVTFLLLVFFRFKKYHNIIVTLIITTVLSAISIFVFYKSIVRGSVWIEVYEISYVLFYSILAVHGLLLFRLRENNLLRIIGILMLVFSVIKIVILEFAPADYLYLFQKIISGLNFAVSILFIILFVEEIRLNRSIVETDILDQRSSVDPTEE